MRYLIGVGIFCIGAMACPNASAQQPTATLVAKGDLMAPQFSSDGSRLLVTGERMHGIAEITIETGDVRWHLDEARVGVHARYLADGSIGFRAKRAGKLRNIRLDKLGTFSEAQPTDSRVFAYDDRIYVRTEDGVLNVATGDKFFAPILSPDRSKVAFTGLATGLHVYDIASRKQTWVGAGTAPAWSPDSESLAFERTEDDGHTIVGSDLWLWQDGASARALARTPHLIERRPSWSPTGSKIAFDDDTGSIYLINVEHAMRGSEATQ